MRESTLGQKETNSPQETLKNFFGLLIRGKFIVIGGIFLRRFRRLGARVLSHPAILKLQQTKRLKRLLYKYYDCKLEVVSDNTLLKVAVIVRDGTTYPKSSVFIRLISPLTHPKVRDKILINLFDENTYKIDKKTNVCIVQRTAFSNEAGAQKFVQTVKSNKNHLVFDTDDAFSLIDSSHPEYDTHSYKVVAKEILVRAADQVWVSTPELAGLYKPLNKNSLVVANTLDDRIWHKTYGTGASFPAAIQMIYMGTATHDSDIEIIMPVMEELATKYPGSFELKVIGVAANLPDRPWLERLYQPRNGSIYPLFVDWFLEQGPFDIGLSPLVDSAFNNSKSDIKCLDYIAAGILPVVSDVLPYQNSELDEFIIRVKNNSKSWAIALEDIVKDSTSFRQKKDKIIPKAQTYLWEKRSVEQTAFRIEKLLEKLTS